MVVLNLEKQGERGPEGKEGKVSPAELAAAEKQATEQANAAKAASIPNPGGESQAILVKSGATWAALAVGTKGKLLQVRSDGTVAWVEPTKVRVDAWGAKGNGGDDTLAIQEAVNHGDWLQFPKPESHYLITSPIVFSGATARMFEGTGSSWASTIVYTGAGFCFQGVAENPANVETMVNGIGTYNLRIEGEENGVSEGGLYCDGCYKVDLNKFEVTGFAKAGAVGIKLQNCFSINIANTHVNKIVNGADLVINGTEQQTTNIHVHDFLFQNSAVGIEIGTTITAGSISVHDGAIRTSAGGVGVKFTGKAGDLTFGPSLHMECASPVEGNTSTAFEAVPSAGLAISNIKFEGIDFYNIKTLFNLNASTGTFRDVRFDQITATGLAGLAGTVFKLNKLAGQVVKGARSEIAGAFYTTTFALTETNITFEYRRIASTALPAVAENKGSILGLTDKTYEANQDFLRVSDGAQWWKVPLATSGAGTLKVPGALIQYPNNVVIGSGTGSPEGVVESAQGGMWFRTDGGAGTTIYVKTTGGLSKVGWVGLI